MKTSTGYGESLKEVGKFFGDISRSMVSGIPTRKIYFRSEIKKPFRPWKDVPKYGKDPAARKPARPAFEKKMQNRERKRSRTSH